MIEIKKIKLKDLQDFIDSEMYLSFTNKPISVLRVASYVHNPNANKEDVVLYMAFHKEKLVAYRTVFSDTFFYDDTKVKFGWLSGNWVHKENRRKGISTLLFNELYEDWNGKLMYTNYAIASKAVYDKTMKFTILKTLSGRRYYRRLCLKDILPPKSLFFSKMEGGLSFLDNFINIFLDIRFRFINNRINNFYYKKIKTEKIYSIDFLKPFKDEELFRREKKIYKWVFKYPWIKSDTVTRYQQNKYYFSSYASKFESDFYGIYNKETNKTIGVIMLTIRERMLKAPYIYAQINAIDPITNLIIEKCNKHKINYLTIFNIDLMKSLEKRRFTFLASKSFEQRYYITKSLIEKYPESNLYKIQSGDGDVVFT